MKDEEMEDGGTERNFVSLKLERREALNHYQFKMD